ncbi:MAG: hypothetical protein M3329_04565, partial [Pseudomonadota bacterium]|nr:hypothetical protein [Pseudomonadota bacterium]
MAAAIAITPWASRKFEDYRQDQLTVERLLETADQQFAAADLFEPRGDNAYRTYQRILAIEPDHPDALKGMARIADKLEQDARAARSFGNLNESVALIRQGLSADPGDEELLDLRKQVVGKIKEERERQRIDRLLADAKRDIKQGRLTRPSDNNAYEAFNAVLRAAPRNADALAGIERIATRIQELAQARQNEGDLQAGLALVDRGLTIKPGHEGLRDLREQIHDQLRQEQERQRIAKALDRAKAQLETGQLIEPRGDNALETHQWILSKDQDNQQARAGIAKIAKRVEERARAALRSGKYEQALVQIERAIQALPGRADFLTLRTEITSAQQTHQQQMRISALLKKGQRQIADGKYLAPEDDNFLQTYKSIRALDPTNATAEQGLRKAAAHFLAQAQEAKSAGEADQALAAISDGLQFVPEHPILRELQTKIYQQQKKDLERERRLAELLERAKTRTSTGHLMVPEGDSAYAAYQEVLKRDPQNKAALRGIAEIAARMHQKAKEMYADGALAKSLAVVRMGLQAKPRHANLTALEGQIQAQIKQKLQAEEKNKRIAELLALAKQQFAALKLTQPVGDNAFESYKEVLSLDAGNEQAKNGLRKVVSRYT